MILFGSQRGSPVEFGAHLTNAEDNELVEIMQLRGAIADDPIGALAEWGLQFKSMTKGKNDLYSLSANPMAPLSEEQVLELADRSGDAMGLDPTRRLIVKHIKVSASGALREHYHIVWPRVDINECKAIPISFDRIKLMQVTRDFARDHGIELPAGFYKYADRQKQTYRQVSLFEKSLTDRGHPSREEHQAIITPLWEGRVSPEGFIKALDHHGYMLAYGRRPVVVDIFGKEHSLARLIAIDAVKVGVIREYLGDHYNEDDLPGVEEAKALAADHIAKTKAFENKEERRERLDALKAGHAARREKILAKIASLRDEQKNERARAHRLALEDRRAHRRAYLEQRREIRAAREVTQPKGLAAFLGRVTGLSFVQKKLHQHRDRQMHEAHLLARRELIGDQKAAAEELRVEHQMRLQDTERQLRELSYREAQELRSLERHLEKQARLRARGIEPAPTPAPSLDLTPMGRRATPAQAKTRYTGLSHQDRAKPQEFKAKAAMVMEDPLAPTTTRSIAKQDKAVNAFDLASGKESPVKRSGVSTKPNSKTDALPDVPTRTVPPLPPQLRELRKQGRPVPKSGELTERFDLAASGTPEMEQDNGHGGDGKLPSHKFEAAVSQSRNSLGKRATIEPSQSTHSPEKGTGKSVPPSIELGTNKQANSVEMDNEHRNSYDEREEEFDPKLPREEHDLDRDLE